MITDLDRSIRPNKWIKRGPQPEVVPPPPNPLIALNNLLARIREEKNPKEKERLEAEFKRECEIYDAINPNSMPLDISAIYREIVTTIAPIANQSAQIIPSDFSMPETVSRDQWLAIHKQIIVCRRSSSVWLSKSRKFASDRWGREFVISSEVQMEMDLGIENKETDTQPTHDDEIIPARIKTMLTRWAGVITDSLDDIDKSKAKDALAILEPIELVIKKLRQMVKASSNTLECASNDD